MYRDRYAHTNDDFYSLGILKLVDVNIFASCVFTFKSVRGISEPENHYQYVENNYYNLRNNSELRLPFCRSLQGQRSPSYYCASNWNSLPVEMKNIVNIIGFKRNLKDHILSMYID